VIYEFQSRRLTAHNHAVSSNKSRFGKQAVLLREKKMNIAASECQFETQETYRNNGSLRGS